MCVVFNDEDRDFRPILLWLIRSTIIPTATSLFATIATGVKLPGRVPLVWFSERAMTMKFGKRCRMTR